MRMIRRIIRRMDDGNRYVCMIQRYPAMNVSEEGMM